MGADTSSCVCCMSVCMNNEIHVQGGHGTWKTGNLDVFSRQEKHRYLATTQGKV